MRIIFLIVVFLVVLVGSSLYSAVINAKPASRLEPTYPLVIYIHKCGRLSRIIYTTGRSGVEETNENDGKETSPQLINTYLKAMAGGFLINAYVNCL